MDTTAVFELGILELKLRLQVEIGVVTAPMSKSLK